MEEMASFFWLQASGQMTLRERGWHESIIRGLKAENIFKKPWVQSDQSVPTVKKYITKLFWLDKLRSYSRGLWCHGKSFKSFSVSNAKAQKVDKKL